MSAYLFRISNSDQGGFEPPSTGVLQTHGVRKTTMPHPMGNWSLCCRGPFFHNRQKRKKLAVCQPGFTLIRQPLYALMLGTMAAAYSWRSRRNCHLLLSQWALVSITCSKLPRAFSLAFDKAKLALKKSFKKKSAPRRETILNTK